ncbi:shikimate kinase [Rhodocyclus tenuis]|uniref:Shikimate kinase n=2 Tax=Rhodocyclus TaxID=1064 RepID=A0A6L5JZF7_RHOTE|nr:AAA family ATPase [Rhodocyclus gracilis]MRD73381.1 AAA family ATPase [Rhodocyclus gracilis]NJA88509.1 shikimate kinase [Rhodocyclus gracilis]
MPTSTPNIYLVGLMGAGKTTIGRALARRIGYGFVDSDHEIVARTGVPIPTIFEIEGEEGFRRREAQVIAELAGDHGRVVATGGGVVLQQANRDHLRSGGMVAYLRVPPRILFERTRSDRNRPLLRVADPLARLEALHAERDPLYREVADIVVEGGRGNAQSITQLLAREACLRWKL